MKTKLHFGIVIALLVFLGRYVESPVTPNQQIVIKFSNAQITNSNVREAIETIQKKLHNIGASHIKVGQNKEGQLKITYFSNSDIAQIKNVLSDQSDFEFAHNLANEHQKNTSDSKEQYNYQINISEIQKSNTTNWDFEGVEIVELNHKSDRSSNLKVNTSGNKINSELINTLVNIAVKSFNTVASTIDNHSYKIPEVRAGPLA